MPNKFKIKKDDPIVVTAGKDKGAKSKVTRVNRQEGNVIVENVNMVKRHTRPNPLNPDGGIVDKEMPLDISNVMYHCKKCDKGVRLGLKELGDKKARFCRSCGEIIDKD